MPKEKSSAEIRVADGAGGMRTVEDLRFEDGDWPIELVVSAKDAATWMLHLDAEVEERQWSASSFSQLNALENSGTLTVNAASGQSPPSIQFVWDKSRDGDLRLKARPAGTPPMPLDDARRFVEAVNERQLVGKTLFVHRRDLLAYEGLPWRGELWLDNEHRLGPPSKHADFLIGPQIVVFDAMVEGIGRHGVDANFAALVQETRVFLGIVLGIAPEVCRFHNAWVPAIDSNGTFSDCKVQSIGYVELSVQSGFPTPGQFPPIEKRAVARPGLGPYGITSDMNQEWVPEDMEQLWRRFQGLSASKRENLLRAGNAHLIARSLWPEQRTAYAAFLVVACEALKPSGKRNDSMNIYDVVASLAGEDLARNLRSLSYAPQRVRSKHLHRGELAAGELLPMFMHDHFRDPSFDEMLRVLSRVTRLCLVEWLRCGGEYRVVRLPRDANKPGARGQVWTWSVAQIREAWATLMRIITCREISMPFQPIELVDESPAPRVDSAGSLPVATDTMSFDNG